MDFTFDKMADVDGDGVVELLRFGCINYPVPLPCGFYALRVTGGPGISNLIWFVDMPYSLVGIPGGEVPKVVDLNRDGLPDLTRRYVGNYLNTGNPAKGDNGSIWKSTTLVDDTPRYPTKTGDVDGDGLYDRITQAPGDYASVFLSTGLNWTANGTSMYNQFLQLNTLPKPPTGSGVLYGECGDFAPGQFQLVDLNVDGLVDIVVNHLGAARPLINTGLAWSDPNFSRWEDSDADFGRGRNAVPIAASADSIDCHRMFTGEKPGIDAFVDLDGDGLPAHITTVPLLDAPVRRRAWLNYFTPAVIYAFPNGLATSTLVYYGPISTNGAQTGGDSALYTDTGTLVDSRGANTRPLRATPFKVILIPNTPM
jgi:hypothetical protein